MRAISIKRLADRLRGVLLATFIVAFAAGALAPGAALAGTLDQQQTDSNLVSDTYSGNSSAQTFTAGVSGGLDQVDLLLEKFGAPTAPLSVEIRDLSGASPGNAVLASRSVPASSVTGGFLSIPFAAPAPVAAGARYAIVAHSLTDGAGGYYRWAGSDENPYAGGVYFSTPDPSSGLWTADPDVDFAFRTYVGPAPGPTGQRAAALKKCKKKLKKNPRKKEFKKCKKRAKRLPV